MKVMRIKVLSFTAADWVKQVLDSIVKHQDLDGDPLEVTEVLRWAIGALSTISPVHAPPPSRPPDGTFPGQLAGR